MSWYDLVYRYFVDLNAYINQKGLYYIFTRFHRQTNFNKLKIDTKQFHFTATTLQVYGTNSYCDMSVVRSRLYKYIRSLFYSASEMANTILNHTKRRQKLVRKSFLIG